MAGEFEGGVGDQLYARLKEGILVGDHRPNERLPLEKLKTRYAVSVTTLRETLTRLSSDGLVVSEGNKGFRVSPLTPRDLQELADFRLLLERHGIERSFANADLDWEARVVAAHYKLEAIEKRRYEMKDPQEILMWIRCDVEFHRALISACGSRTIISEHTAALDKSLRFPLVIHGFDPSAAASEHGELKRCALERDLAGALEALESHVGDGVMRALKTGELS